jgi:acyl-CoA synthetase (AMP-forming)/AMP-acid ligase II
MYLNYFVDALESLKNIYQKFGDNLETPFIMSGYFINGKIISELKDGLFYTGDIGYLENNRLYITGRKGERIKKRANSFHYLISRIH